MTKAIDREEVHAVSVNAYMVGVNHHKATKKPAVIRLQSGPQAATKISSLQVMPRKSPSMIAPNGIKTILLSLYPRRALAKAWAHSC